MSVEALGIAVQVGIPVLLWGQPGTGKSTTVRALGEALRVPVEVVIASIREPSDFSGLPVLEEGRVRMAPPAWAVRLHEAGRGILFLDEINTAPPAVQAALLRVVLDRTVGDLELPDGVSVVAAANPTETAAGGWELSAPLANRFLHLEWTLPVERWVQGMAFGWELPQPSQLPHGWNGQLIATRGLIADFIQRRPDLLLQMPESSAELGRAWPSPRSWDFAAQLLAAAQAIDAPFQTVAELVCGAVGVGPGMELLEWMHGLDLPDPEELLDRPEQILHVVDRSDRLFAALSAVVRAVDARPTKKRIRAAWKIFGIVVEQGSPDVAAIAVRHLARLTRKHQIQPKELRHFLPLLSGVY